MFSNIYTYRFFIVNSVKNEFITKFAKSKLGVAWAILHPLAQVLIYATILSSVLSAKLPGIDSKYAYAIYLMSGMLCWMLFSEIFSRCIGIFTDNANIIKKMSFPKIDKIMKIKDEGKVDESLFDPLVKIIDKIDKLKNYISGQNLKKYIENVLQIAVYHQELELAKISVTPSDTKMEKVNKLLEWAEMHKYWMFSAAGGINADMEVTKKASENLVKELKKRGLIETSEIGEVKEEFRLSI